jgi:hypothetical protein
MSKPLQHENKKRIKDVILQWLIAPASVYGTRNYSKVNSAMQQSWPDFQLCAHASCSSTLKLCEMNHLFEKKDYKACGMCLESGEEIFPFTTPAKINIAELEGLIEKYAEVRKECTADAVKRRNEALHTKDERKKGQTFQVTLSNEMLRKERDAWYSLMALAFDVVRPMLIGRWEKWNDQYEQVEDDDGQDLLDTGDVVDMLRQFLCGVLSYHYQRSNTLTPPQIYCYTHNCMGFALPTEGRNKYKSCWICRSNSTVGMPTEETAGRGRNERMSDDNDDDDDQKHQDSPRQE